MKRKYKCYKCQHENIVDIADMINLGLGGMGGSGALLTEMGLGQSILNSGFLGGGGLPFNLPKNARDFKHNCEKCGETNIVKII